jgi:hypothetical protein
MKALSRLFNFKISRPSHGDCTQAMFLPEDIIIEIAEFSSPTDLFNLSLTVSNSRNHVAYRYLTYSLPIYSHPQFTRVSVGRFMRPLTSRPTSNVSQLWLFWTNTAKSRVIFENLSFVRIVKDGSIQKSQWTNIGWLLWLND